jgi:hypothetical protein
LGRETMKALDAVDAMKRFYNSSARLMSTLGRAIVDAWEGMRPFRVFPKWDGVYCLVPVPPSPCRVQN